MPTLDGDGLCFVVGTARSGTTLLSALLGRHSAVVATPETEFFHFAAQLRRGPAPPRRHQALLAAHLANRRLRDLELEPERVLGRLASYPPADKFVFLSLVEELAAESGAALVVEKTPLHLGYVPRILSCFPRARVLLVLRDGRDVALSLRKAPWIHNDLSVLALRWCQGVDQLLRWERRFPANVLRVRYERLLQEPARELRRIDRFVSLTFEPRQLERSDTLSSVPGWELDWKGKALEEIDVSRAQVWRAEAQFEELHLLNSIQHRHLERVGYGETEARGEGWREVGGFALRRAALLLAYHERIHPLAQRGRALAEGLGVRFQHRHLPGAL